MAKLRSGHYVGLRAYQYRIQSGVPDPTCPLCGEDDQDLEHWLTRCPATAARRWELFGGGSGCLDCLTRSPLGVLALARETLGHRVALALTHTTCSTATSSTTTVSQDQSFVSSPWRSCLGPALNGGPNKGRKRTRRQHLQRDFVSGGLDATQSLPNFWWEGTETRLSILSP